jgi:hypothetical protein
MLHLKDMKVKKEFTGNGENMGEWMALFPYMSSAGEGILNIDQIINIAKNIGIEHYFVEHDMVANPAVELKKSATYVSNLI